MGRTLFAFCLLATLALPASAPALRLHGEVRRSVTKSVIAEGEIELRLPGHEDRFVSRTAPLREDGSYELLLPFADLPERPGDLTLTALSPGFVPQELPLAFPEGTGVPEEWRTDFTLSASTLDGILDIFSCCVLSWSVLTVMLPAFLLGAAITAFVPSQYVLRYLGPSAPKPLAYGAAITSGMVLSLCSCNVVPLFISIWAGGAGIGPAFAFLYAGPAINLVAISFTCRVIGLGIGLYRVVSVALISLVVGLVMARIFGERQDHQPPAAELGLLHFGPSGRVTATLLGLLLYLLVVGSLEVGLVWSLALFLPGVAGLVLLAVFGLGREHCLEWGRETWSLLKKVIPILIPAVLIIGFATQHVPLTATRWLSGSNGFSRNLAAAVFGALMYFPILTEVAFVKAMLKVMGMGIGPGIALLLTAPGLSLPGMVIVGRDIGWKRLIVYVGCIVLLASMTGWFFGSEWGQYICNCML